LEAFAQIPRAGFVPAHHTADAYRDEPIDIGQNQVTTQPSLIGVMVQGLGLTGTEKVLEIGSGFGFQTAILSRLCRQVFSMESSTGLAREAESNRKRAGIRNAKIIVGGTLGLPDHAPFEAVIVSATAPQVPEPLIERLIEGGRLVQPVGPGCDEKVMSFHKIGGALLNREEIAYACFVPLVGRFGIERESVPWPHGDAPTCGGLCPGMWYAAGSPSRDSESFPCVRRSFASLIVAHLSFA
jgi:protein-L-isoaspartate(D-aspartate) O-methyltransferase